MEFFLKGLNLLIQSEEILNNFDHKSADQEVKMEKWKSKRNVYFKLEEKSGAHNSVVVTTYVSTV